MILLAVWTESAEWLATEPENKSTSTFVNWTWGRKQMNKTIHGQSSRVEGGGVKKIHQFIAARF